MPPPSKTAPSLLSSRSTCSTTSSRPTPSSFPQQERARVLTGSSSLSPSSSRETKSPGSPTTPIFNFGGEICEAQKSSREEATGGTGGREEEGGSGIEILGGSSRLAAALGIEEEAHEGRVTSPTFKETMAKLQAFGKGGISVVWLKGTMAVSQIVALTVVLVLARTTPSPTSPSIVQSSACPSRYPLAPWLVVHIVRVGICWPTSVWLYLRRERVSREGGDLEGASETLSDPEEVRGRGREREDSAATAFTGLSGSTRVRSPSTSSTKNE
ncbi:hypothetical protein BDY24DRAFT_124204 [Mrakia frigida]|uniref:uncharacterized protein n=1 Tax=Mrakia frigida TaxID=29902 RepID=UPI003FCC22DD